MSLRSMSCSAKDCGVNSILNPGLRLFHFPRINKDAKRFEIWCSVTGIAEGQPHRMLCERHFGVDQFRQQGLIYRAVPKYPTGPLNSFTSNYAPLTPINLETQGLLAVDMPVPGSSSFCRSSPERPPHTPLVRTTLPHLRASTSPLPYQVPLRASTSPLPDQVPLRASASPLPDQVPLRASTSPLPDQVPLHASTSPLPHQVPHRASTSPLSHSLSPAIDPIPPAKSTPPQPCYQIKPKSENTLLRFIKVTRYAQITPREQRLITFAKRQQRSSARLRKHLKAERLRLKALQDLKRDPEAFIDQFNDFMSHSALMLFKAQVRCSAMRPKGRRWSVEEKVMAASLYKKSPKCYHLLRTMLALPTKRTLISFVDHVPFQPGINSQMFDALEQSLTSLGKLASYCSMIFDEMSIKESLEDVVVGCEDLGRTSNLSGQVLVFMAQGLFNKWKQPLAFYFSKNGLTAETLVELIREVLTACFKAKLKVVATICDMSSTHVIAMDLLGSREDAPFFWQGDQKIFTIFDPPHLLKSTRNMFMKHNIRVPIDIALQKFSGPSQTLLASWDHIIEAVKLSQHSISGLTFMPKMTDEHLHPKMENAMKVKLAAQIFSQSVGAAVDCFVRFGKLPVAAIGTVEVLKTMNALFDSLNGIGLKPEGYLGLRTSISIANGYSRLVFWEDCIRKISSWEFLEMSTSSRKVQPFPPCQRGWIWTLNGFKMLWVHLNESLPRLKYLETRRLNQDPLENLFSLIRSQCGGCFNPTATQFVSALKTSLVNGLAFRDQRNTNCEPEVDPSPLLNTLTTFLDGST